MGWDKNAFGFGDGMRKLEMVNGAALEGQRCDPSAARETVGAGRMPYIASGGGDD
jgi:hypothetical protein